MTNLFTILLITALAAPALAHTGHPHTGVPAGEWHHLLWLAVPLAMIAFVCMNRVLARRG